MNPILPEDRATIEKMDRMTKDFIETFGDGMHNLGQRTKFGGQPTWEQNPEEVTCPDCGTSMSFVAQIDSFNHDWPNNPNRMDCVSNEPKFMFGDVGMIYVFFCFDCLTVETVFQCG
jgi:hypothetical protein